MRHTGVMRTGCTVDVPVCDDTGGGTVVTWPYVAVVALVVSLLVLLLVVLVRRVRSRPPRVPARRVVVDRDGRATVEDG